MRRALLSVALFGAAALALAGPASRPPLLTVEAKLAPESGAGKGALTVEARIAEGWHVNSHKPSEDYLIPTALQLAPASGVTFGEPKYPDGVQRKFAFSESPLSVYEERFTITVPVAWSGSAPPEIVGTIDYQACNDRQCNPPASAAFRTGAGAASDSATAALPGGAVALSQGPAGSDGGPPSAGRGLSDQIANRGYPLVLLSVFAIGLGLNLTPCVYPVIPLTIGFFGGQAAGSRRRVLLLACLYVAGIVVMYSALGVVAATTGKLFGALLQNRLVLAGIALVLVALSLSMFGLYDIQPPSWLMQRAGARSGVTGAFAMGLLVGVVAAPCVAPFTVGLLTFVAERQSLALGVLFFGVLGLGLGAPYVALGAFSGSLARLPRAGAWMDGVKRVFGLLLLAMAAYFLRLVLPPPLSHWLLPAVLAIAALAALAWGLGLPAVGRAAATIVFAAGAFLFLPKKTEAWQRFDESALRSAGRPAIVDFGADWCIPCLELEQRTFSDPRVREALRRRSLYKADLTRGGSAEVAELSKRYRILGVPTVIFLDEHGREKEDLRLVGFEGPDQFLQRLEKAP